MTKARLLTAGCLLPIFISIICFAPNNVVVGVAAVIWLLALWELYFNILRLSVLNSIVILIIFMGITCAFRLSPTLISVVIHIAAVLWLCLLPFIICYNRCKPLWQNRAAVMVLSFFMFVPSFLSVEAVVHFGDRIWLLLFCAVVWGIDSGAYFAGKYCGKKKLLPAVSPNKTWVGVGGGIIAGAIVIYGFSFVEAGLLNFNIWLPLLLLTVPYTIFGDLAQSAIKRSFGVKDSGSLMPGHGGVFDRIDAMLAAFTIIYVWLKF